MVKENNQTCSLKYTHIEGHSSKPCIKHGTSEKYVNVHIQSMKTYYTVTKTDHVAIVMFKQIYMCLKIFLSPQTQ